MSLGKTGNLCDVLIGEVRFEWKIEDFLQLSDKTDTYYESPEFYCAGACWEIWIYPNGFTEDESERWISLYVVRLSGDIPLTMDYSISLKSLCEETYKGSTEIFDEVYEIWGIPKFLRRSELIEKKAKLLPLDVLTVICTLKKREKDNATGFCGLQQHLEELLSNESVSDVTLKVDNQEFKAHRSILAARSPVFLAMMTHETKEKISGVVEIPDVDPNIFPDFLKYLYTGNMENVTSQNVDKLYIVADKYQVDELKEVSVDYMLKNLAVDTFCDFLTISLRYAEGSLTNACSRFFMENALDIILTSTWQTFLSENPIAGNELYIKHLQSTRK